MIDDLIPVVVDLPVGQDVVIYPISDLHYGSPECDIKAWNSFMSKLMSEPNSYITVGGDMINNGLSDSKTNCFFETSTPSEQRDWLAEQLYPIACAGKLLCVCSGNHERRSEKNGNANPLYSVCREIGIQDRYRSYVDFLVCRFGDDRKINSKYRPTYTFCVAHGASERIDEKFLMSTDVDVLIAGHLHRPKDFPTERLVLDTHNKQVIQKHARLVISTAWLKYGGYPMEKLMTPVPHCLAEIQLSANGKQVRVLQ